jgi:Tfp pilus assembly protein FimV
MAEQLEIKALESQMNDEVGQLTRLQQQIEAKKELVNKLDGAIWALKMERQESNVNAEDSNAVSAMGEKAD